MSVDQAVEAAIGKERGGVVHDRRLGREEDRWNSEIVIARLDRGDEDPIERSERENQEEDDEEKSPET
jgi:hypothetical protein